MSKEEELQAEIKQLKADKEALKLTVKIYLNSMLDSLIGCMENMDNMDKKNIK